MLLVDASKIGVMRAGLIAPLPTATRIITGQDAAAKELDAIRALGIMVEVV
jgi:DeoR/GlpR family transcriptional regulator of sugar metabolism